MRMGFTSESQAIRLGLQLQFAAMGALAGALALAVSLRLSVLHLALPLTIAAGALVAALITASLGRNLIRPLFAQLRLLEQQRDTPLARERVLGQVSEQAAEEARARLARDLHDSIKQQLFSINVSTAAAQARWDSDPVAARLAVEDAQRSAREAQVEISALLQDLRPAPLDGVGLLEALREQGEALGYRTGAEVTLEFQDAPVDYTGYPQGIQEALFRIAQEALANVARHARARKVLLRLGREGNAIVLEISDDGQGFAATTDVSGTGQASILERALTLAGHAQIDSIPGKGSTVKVSIPPLGHSVAGEAYRLEPSEIESVAESGRRAHKSTEDAVTLAGIFILLGTPFWLVTLAIPVALFEYFRSSEASTHITLLTDKNSVEAREQRYLIDDSSSTILVFLAFCLWYAPVGLDGLLPALVVHTVTFSAVLLCLLLAAVQLARTYRGLDRWLSLLPPRQCRRELSQRSGRIASAFSLWLIIVVLAVATGSQLHLAAPPLTFSQWSDDAILAILVLWPLLIAVEYLTLLRWRRQLARSIEDVLHE